MNPTNFCIPIKSFAGAMRDVGCGTPVSARNRHVSTGNSHFIETNENAKYERYAGPAAIRIFRTCRSSAVYSAVNTLSKGIRDA